MSLLNVPAGKDAPNDIYVIIENPAKTPNIKYEIDKETGCLFVDRFAPMPMVFPAHYGYINKTLGGDGDPVDAFVITDVPVVPGAVVRARPVAVLITEDESGRDEKVLCVPHQKLDRRYDNVNDLADVCPLLIEQISQFYEHYKNLEKGKWVKVTGWEGTDKAREVIDLGVKNYK